MARPSRAAAASEDAALLTFELPPRPEAAGAARRALAAFNESLALMSDARLLDAQTALTELVTNAIRHGGDGRQPVRVELRASEQNLRVTVTDAGPGFDPDCLPPPSPVRGGGYGLRVVAALSQRWGVERGSPTTVWFEIARPGRP